jgi:hypothetical protein
LLSRDIDAPHHFLPTELEYECFLKNKSKNQSDFYIIINLYYSHMVRSSRGNKKKGDYLTFIGIGLIILGFFIFFGFFFSEVFYLGIFLGMVGLIFIFVDQEDIPKVANTQQHQIQECQSPGRNHDDSHGRDPVLQYEVSKGHFGDSSKQSLTYQGKKTRWR